MQRRYGFTLIELLVVVAIIVALLAMLLPSLNGAIAIAEDAKCRTQLRSISQGFLQFAADHNATLPGVYYTHYTESWTWSWIGREVWPAVSTDGTLLKYVGGEGNVVQNKLYRCPSLPNGTPGSGVGSNTWFDYGSFIAFSGAKLTNLPTTATVRDSITGESRIMSAPIVIEEDPAANINLNTEPGHANVDRLATTHTNNGGNIAAIDGSVAQFNASQPGAGPTPIADWTAISPSGNLVDLHHTNTGFGDWNRR